MTERYFNIAIDQAKKSSMNMKHGAVLVINGRIVSKGFNHHRNAVKGKLKFRSKHNIKTDHMCSLHSEMHCLLTSGLTPCCFLRRQAKKSRKKQICFEES